MPCLCCQQRSAMGSSLVPAMHRQVPSCSAALHACAQDLLLPTHVWLSMVPHIIAALSPPWSGCAATPRSHAIRCRMRRRRRQRNVLSRCAARAQVPWIKEKHGDYMKLVDEVLEVSGYQDKASDGNRWQQVCLYDWMWQPCGIAAHRWQQSYCGSDPELAKAQSPCCGDCRLGGAPAEQVLVDYR